MSEKTIAQVRLMLVEDHQATRDRLCSLLDGHSQYTVVAAVGSAEEAVRILMDHTVDIIILDLGLPGMPGSDAIQIFKSVQPDLEIIIFTAMDEDEQVFAALKAGATGYILKDAQPLEILNAIQELRAGGAPMSFSIARKMLREFQNDSRDNESKASAQSPLSGRETEILELLYQGNSPKDIAERLGISLHTVNTHIKNIYKKLHVNSCTQAIYEARKSQAIRV